MMTPERFRVLNAEKFGVARDVPWALVEPLRERAMSGHNQTLERLNERGGLSPVELYALVHALPFSEWTKFRVVDVMVWFKGWAR